MPTVPRARQQVAATPLPGVRVSGGAPAAAFGVEQPLDLSAPIQVLGGIVGEQRRVADEARAQADQVAVSDADARLVRAKTQRLWHPETGAMTARGKDAIPRGDAAQAAFQQDAADIEATLATDAQKQAFRRRANLHFADLGNALGQHVGSQIRQYDEDTTEGHLTALSEEAVTGYQDAATVQRAVDDTRAVATDYWRRNGHGEGERGVDEFAQAHIAQRVSAIRAAVFDQLSSSGQDLAASAYFDAHKAEFTGRDRESAEKIAKAGSSRARAQSETARIVGTHAESMDAAIAEAQKIDEPTVQDDVVRRIRQHFADKAADITHSRQQNYQKASEILEKSRGNLDAVPFRLRASLLPDQNTALEHRAEQIRHPKQVGDSETFFHLKNLAHISDESRAEFLTENIATGYPNLSDRQRSELLTLQYEMSGRAKRAAAQAAKAAAAGGAAAPNVAATPVAPAKPYNPLAGMSADGPAMTKTPTPAMLRDVAAKGPEYATYLRAHGYKIP